MCWRGTTRLSTRALTPGRRTSLLNVLKELQKVCNHPFLFVSAEKDTFRAARRAASRRRLPRRLKRSAGVAGSDSPARPPPPITPSRRRSCGSSSGNIRLLAKLLPKLRARGHRILLFCQMTSHARPARGLARARASDSSSPTTRRIVTRENGSVRPVYSRIDGGTPLADRQRVIVDFNTPGSRHARSRG